MSDDKPRCTFDQISDRFGLVRVIERDARGRPVLVEKETPTITGAVSVSQWRRVSAELFEKSQP